MDIFKKQTKKYLESRKATLMERLRNLEYEEDKFIGNGDINSYMLVHRETLAVNCQLSSIRCRIHNMDSQNRKYFVLERETPAI